jgi:diaminopimelate decarboxylase
VITDLVREAAEGLPAGALPAYVHDLDALRAHAGAVRAALPERVELFYAVKANPDAEVLKALSGLVEGYEVSSGGELAHVRAAVPGERLAFGGPGKAIEELELAVRAGVDRLHLESPHEARTAARLAREQGEVVDVLLRVNLRADGTATQGAALAMGGVPSPFGMDEPGVEEALDLLAGADGEGLRLRGIHAHLASGLHAEAHAEVARQVLGWTSALERRLGLTGLEVNLGGGMAVGYDAGAAQFDWERWAEKIREPTAAPEHARRVLRIEPGRALTAACGWYVTEVLDVKASHGEQFAVVRGGTHHLRTPAARGHSQPATRLPVERWRDPGPRPRATGSRVTVVGQLCTPKDVLTRGAELPGLRAGDRVAFAMAGAYAWNISHHDFLMHRKPTFHHVG